MATSQYNNWPTESTITMRARADSERRSGFDRRVLSTTELEMLRCCRLAGVMMHGIQPTYNLTPDGDLLLFGKSKYATTWAMPISKVTPLALLAYVHEAEARASKQPVGGFRLSFKPSMHPAVRVARSA